MLQCSGTCSVTWLLLICQANWRATASETDLVDPNGVTNELFALPVTTDTGDTFDDEFPLSVHTESGVRVHQLLDHDECPCQRFKNPQ